MDLAATSAQDKVNLKTDLESSRDADTDSALISGLGPTLGGSSSEDVLVKEYVTTTHTTEDANVDIYEELYLAILKALKAVSDLGRLPNSKQSKARTLHDSVSNLYIWGESFRHGKLGRALGQSDELRNVVLETLCTIAKLAIGTIADQSRFLHLHDL